MNVRVRSLGPDDVGAYRAVRLTVLRSDPLAFGATAEGFAALPLAEVAERLVQTESKVTFGAFLGAAGTAGGPAGNGSAGARLVGILTLVRLTQPGFTHRADIVGVGVLTEARGRGAGDALMWAALGHAGSWPDLSSVHLAVTETQGAARRLYERHGFTVRGTQPDAIRRAGQVVQEHFMWRPVSPGCGAGRVGT